MRSRYFGLALSLAVAGCGTAAGVGIPDRGERSVQAADSSVRIPTLDEMRRLIPERLTSEEADRLLVKVPADKILVPDVGAPDGGSRIEPSRGGRGFGGGFGRGMGGPGFGRGIGHGFGLGRGFGRGFGRLGYGLGFGGLYPFSYYGSSFFAPYLVDGGLYSPYAFSPYALGAPYLASPFIAGGCGTYLPFGFGRAAPAWVGAAYGTFGCGGGFPAGSAWF